MESYSDSIKTLEKEVIFINDSLLKIIQNQNNVSLKKLDLTKRFCNY